MSVLRKFRQIIFRLQQKLLYSIVKTKIIGADIRRHPEESCQPTLYAMNYPSLAERLVIDRELKGQGWHTPSEQLQNKLMPGKSFFNIYKRSANPFRSRAIPVVDKYLIKQAAWMMEDPNRDITVLPVKVMWGRAPEKEQSFVRIWLQRGGTIGNRLKTIFAVIFNGRNTFVHFSEPLSLRELAGNSESAEMVARKLARVLRVHNRQVTNSVLGPDLSHRRTLVHQLPNKPLVRKVIEAEAGDDAVARQKLKDKARKYADEMASNISYTNIRFLDVLLTWVWNKIYDGISLHNVDPLKEVSKNNTIIYVPCHRSHIDYLLLSYILYHQGLQMPQIAAGINLNMPIVGSILRRGGAFFMRRTFRDNPLYAAVFDEYLHSMFTHGYSTEYFVEGGRSRTGRTLTPKAGMLAMTVRSYLRDSRKPIIFMPVYTGYEKVFEESSYLGELRGQSKKKESIFGVLGSLKAFKKSFGKVNVTFGDPIYLSEFLEGVKPGWRDESYEASGYRPDWAPTVVNQLAVRIGIEINRAASVNPVNLIALTILTAPRHSMDEQQLSQQMEAYRDLLGMAPYSHITQLPEGNGETWIEYAERLKIVSRSPHTMGDIIQTDERQAVTLTYYRNNVLHILALPSLIACLMMNNRRCTAEDLFNNVKILYPFMQSELFLHWDDSDLQEAITHWIDVFCQRGYFEKNEEFLHCLSSDNDLYPHLHGLSDHAMQTLQRYYLTIARMQQQGSGQLTAQQLEEQSTQLAQRISLLYGINSPEFFDKNLFKTLIQKMIKEDLISNNEEGVLSFDARLKPLVDLLEQTLDASLRQTIIHSL
ncbi:MAG: glycerol-3-phosphate 1-O-acyltransferase PlsB [Oleibacter sp.]|nr:glycerol-3-phosphate 1-O-acyltransferase PlsB [Thalassolituus sp.]